ncbi:MAG: fasciclin domain-containing protein [Bacteroidota bacterium]
MKHKFRIIPVAALVLLFTVNSCLEQPPQVWDPEDQSLQIAEYMEVNPERYSEFYEMTVRTEFVHLLRARGPYTLFLPTNEAMAGYYSKLGIGSIDEISAEKMETLVRNHLFSMEIPSSGIGLGALNDTNALGDYISTEFLGSDIVLAKNSKIIKRDIRNANGLVHVIDDVLHPVTQNIYQVVAEIPEYSIFTEGVRRTGIRELLEMVEGPYGRTTVRKWFTLLAVPDSVYADSSIHSIEELIGKYDDGAGAITEPGNGFYKYMEYHCLDGVHYLSDFITGVYPILSRENQVKMDVDTAYLINFNEADSTYSSFIMEGTNVTAKNGVIHPVDGLLPAIDPIPTRIIVQTTDYPDLKSEDCYMNYIKNFTDGKNQFARIKWQGDYLQYYYKRDQNYIDYDCISMSQGFWWLEFTLPKIPKGKYLVSGRFKTGENRANLITYIDGVKLPKIIETRSSSFIYTDIEIGVVDWEETEEHTVRFKTIFPGTIYFDYFIFNPTY